MISGQLASNARVLFSICRDTTSEVRLADTLIIDDKMRLISYNPGSLNDINLNYRNELSKICDILAMQEHWKLSRQFHKITDGIKDFTGTAISGVEESIRILRGHPYGGYALLWMQV